jgi:3-oxoacyl-[acyl-carrier-protein] synthase-1
MEALERAALDDTAIVGAVDSLLDDDTLAWLRRTMRLKTKGLAAGIVPGEAAVLFLLSRRAAYGALGTVEAVAFDAEERPLESAQSPLGRGLARVVGRLAQQAAWPGQERAWIVSDHNGEPYAAADWGWAQHRLAGSVLPDDAETWFPAVSFGDTGGAGAAAAMMCAIAAWKRGYAPAARCAIMACQDDGRRAGLMLSAPGGERHGRS